jgi:hypothetical protein
MGFILSMTSATAAPEAVCHSLVLQLLALAACTSRPRSAPGAGKRWPLPLELTVKVLQALDAGLVASAIRYSSSAPS